MKDIMTLQEAAEYLQVHEMTLYRWAKRGLVPGAVKLGGRWRIQRAKLEQGLFGEAAGICTSSHKDQLPHPRDIVQQHIDTDPSRT